MIYLEDLRNATGGQLFGETAAREFTGFCDDADSVQPGQLYVALRGEAEDGHLRIAEAIEKGATGVLCQEPPNTTVSGVTVLLVGDTAAALGQWAAYVLRQYGTLVTAVAGTVGRGITATSIAAILSGDFAVHFAPIKRSGLVGLAMSLGGLDKHHQIAVVEVETHRAGEMPSLLAVVQPSIAVITRLLPRLASNPERVERSLIEAQALLRSLPSQGMAVINYDDPKSRTLINSAPSAVLTISTSGADSSPADLVAFNVEYFVDKVGFDLKNGMQKLRGHWTPTLGEAGLEAALGALAVGLLFEVPIQRALDTVKSLPPQVGHMMVLEGVNQTFLIDDTTNASVSSTLSALSFLQAINSQGARRFVVVGDLAGSSDETLTGYDEIGRQMATIADYLITLGDGALGVAQSASRSGMPSDRILPLFRHADVVSMVHKLTRADDIIFVTGARTTKMERVTVGLLKNSEDSEWVRRDQSIRLHRPAAPSWIEIDLDALAHNLRQIKERVGETVKVMAVVKGNAYGHGAVEIASTALQNGADLLAVAHADEGLTLRNAGLHEPILVLGVVPPAMTLEAIRHNLILSIWDQQGAQSAAYAAGELQKQALVHIRVETGFGDYGLPVSEVAPLVRELVKLDNVVIDGLYTDFAAADTLFEAASTHEQLDRFQKVVTGLKATGISIPHIHAANSCAILTLPSSYFTAVRAGIITYGLHPSIDVSAPAGFRRVLSWKTTIGQIKTISEGTAVGYGSTYRADHEMRIAILPVGYSDGFRDSPRNWGEVLVGGKFARLIGRVGMDRCVIDVTGIPKAAVGQEVVLIGTQGGEKITVEDVARRLDCTSYEVIASLSPRIPRIPSWSIE